MGWDIVAYFDVDQRELDDYIAANNIDKYDGQPVKLILNYYREKYICGEDKDVKFELDYYWDNEFKLHRIYDIYRTNFIRNDDRFWDREIQAKAAERLRRPFPECLRSLHWYIQTSEDALEIAGELGVFFPDDEEIGWFATWLRNTAKYCSAYEFSW